MLLKLGDKGAERGRLGRAIIGRLRSFDKQSTARSDGHPLLFGVERIVRGMYDCRITEVHS